MAIFEFKLPDLGEGVVEGEIVKWLVEAGQPLAEDQGVLEVMTDKATVVVPSARAGKVLERFGKVGDTVKVHQTLLRVEVAEGQGSAATTPTPAAAHGAPAASASAKAAEPVAAPASDVRVLATPVTRRMAREHGIDLSTVEGSGPQGRVTKADVERSLQSRNAAPAPAASKLAPLATVEGDERVPLRGLRKRIAEKMVRSKTLMPHFTFVEEVDAGALMAMRKRINAQLEAQCDKTRLSFLPFIAKALIAALRKFPQLNANFDEAAQELVIKKQVHIGIAVATDDGLIVPVVKNAQAKSLRVLSGEVQQLADAARARRNRPEELSGGTITITSLGQTGGLFATPIINHPEVAIVGIHKMRERAVFRAGKVEPQQVMCVSLSFDHRVIDGSVGAEFTYELIRYLETPELLLLEMT